MFSDVSKLSQTREPETLTLEYERKRLKSLGIDKELQWMSLDDCFAGYDVLSYDLGDFAPINRMIEVKFTIATALRFETTRDEWEQAKRLGTAYIYHVWDMQKTPPVLYELTTAQIAAHIPSDHGKGRWETAEIPLGN